MNFKPILFNTEMVKAILEGRKTQTRRIIHGLESLQYHNFMPCDESYETRDRWDFWYGSQDEDGAFHDSVISVNAPCSVGDILWVREKWQHIYGGYKYAAYCDASNGSAHKIVWVDVQGKELPWHPSIHMPKEASRIFLRVTDIHVEWLHEMDEEAAIAEGFEDSPAGTDSPLERFTTLWDKTVKREDLRYYGYHANPLVWVITFERCDRPEGWPAL